MKFKPGDMIIIKYRKHYPQRTAHFIAKVDEDKKIYLIDDCGDLVSYPISAIDKHYRLVTSILRPDEI